MISFYVIKLGFLKQGLGLKLVDRKNVVGWADPIKIGQPNFSVKILRGNRMVTEKKEKKTSDIIAFEFISYRYYINITI